MIAMHIEDSPMDLFRRFFIFLIVVICNILFLYETLQSVKKYSKFETARSVSVENLADVGLPVITLCHESGYSHYSLKSLGYDSFQSFAEGKILNASQYGWVGTGNNSIKEVFEEAYISPNILKILRNDSYLKLNGKEIMKLNWKEKRMVYPEGKCFELDQDPGPSSDIALILKFQERFNFTGKIQLIMSDPNKGFYRPDILSSSGDKIEIIFHQNRQKVFSVYTTKIHKTEDMEKDTAANCFSYKESSYKNCTDSVIQETYLDEIGCVPPWFTYNEDLVCNHTFDKIQWRNIPAMIFRHFDQTTFPDCKQPCTRFYFSTKVIRIVEPYHYQGLKILFNPSVEVALSVPTMTVLGLLSNIGGFLGLFLGVSILQVLLKMDRWIILIPQALKESFV